MVLRKIWGFIKRHKGKIVVTGGLIAGLYATASYLKGKLEEYHEKQMADTFEKARKQTHYDSNQRTCNSTVLSLMPNLKETLMKELNCERLTELLQQKPTNKVHIWSELKIMAFTRAILSVYSTCILVLTLRVQFNIIGGCMYFKKAFQNPLSEKDQKTLDNYLSSMKYFLETGIHQLMDVVKLNVEKELLNCSLKQLMSLQRLQEILRSLRTSVEGSSEQTCSNLAKYIVPDESSEPHDEQTEHGDFTMLPIDTKDLVRSEDFNAVLQDSLSYGFSFLSTHLSHVFNSETLLSSQLTTTCDKQIPLVKLIPPLSGSIHCICTDIPEKYLQKLFCLSGINEFGQEIYTSYSQPPAETSR